MNNTINPTDLIMDELEEFMMQAEIEELGLKLAEDMEDGEKFAITNKSDADFYIKLINKLRKQKDEINEFVDSEKERQDKIYEDYRRDRLRPLDTQIAFYEGALRTFALNEYEETGKKSIKLPNGSLNIRKQQPKYTYDDEQLLEYLQKTNRDSLIKTKHEVDKRELKKVGTVTSNNELMIDNDVVPGVVVTPQEDKFEVK